MKFVTRPLYWLAIVVLAIPLVVMGSLLLAFHACVNAADWTFAGVLELLEICVRRAAGEPDSKWSDFVPMGEFEPE